jgi:hypothetical protein
MMTDRAPPPLALRFDVGPVDDAAADAARARQAQLTKPAGSLGALEDVAVQLAGWQGRERLARGRRRRSSSPPITRWPATASRPTPPR